MKEVYDVVVIGAGPAGSTAAQKLAEAGCRVLLIDQARRIGENVQCAEFVPRLLRKYAPLCSTDIAQPVDGIQTWIEGRLAHRLQAPGFTIHRACWDKHLAEQAVAAGAGLQTGVRVIERQGDSTLLAIDGARKKLIRCRWVLGCDGPRSVVSGWLGNERQPVSVALQYELALRKPLRDVAVYFESRFYGGYGWVFPKGQRANVGLGVHQTLTANLEELLQGFCRELIERQILRDQTVYRKTAGLIPCGGLVRRVAGGKLLLAGDAAGCTHPLTGGGIFNAVLSGRLAAEHIAGASGKAAEQQSAAGYGRSLNGILGQYLATARRKMLVRDANWLTQPFDVNIRRNWIAFPEYYTSGVPEQSIMEVQHGNC